ncbi:hypothetical protein EUX98_g4372 [Antrodiella citrinella]|uniref:Pre-mRNA-splicing factor ISY1 n=1 Tax=Antrodiella citrinella TaxID=2447956 RepID=A0A4S4MWY4_9APHY|nr:hypothetical protein EUX98_g4372 [Antrodiella citrinella]
MASAGLTDYEVRDLNDEINKLMREKRHWENQIVALGGANYRRNVAMVDDDGKEVPGTKGYKYFGRAKDLPGVKELFQSRKKDEDEENVAHTFYKKFMNQGPAYFGDLDEQDGTLLEYERQAEEEEWQDAYSHLRTALKIPEDEPTPPIPRGVSISHTDSHTNGDVARSSDSKRKAPDGDVDMTPSEAFSDDASKRVKTNGVPPQNGDALSPEETMLAHARATAAYIPFLTPDHLLPPKLPSRVEMEEFLLGLRKKALVEEYFGEA